MADFNVGLRPTADPNYEGSVKEASRFDYRNDSMANLFAGIGDAVSGAANVADNEIKENIKTDVQTGVDSLRNAQGVDAAVATTPGSMNFDSQATKNVVPGVSPGGGGDGTTGLTANKPPNSDDLTARMGKLTDAYKAGKLGDTAYYAQLESLTRQIRARYPGYRDQVDNMIQTVAGVTPANALRKSVLSDIQSSQSATDKEKDKQWSFVKENLQYLTPDQIKQVSSGQVDFPGLLQTIAGRKSEEFAFQSQKLQLETQAAKGKANADDAAKVATDGIGGMMTRMWQDSTSGMKDLNDRLLKAQQSGAALSPQDLQQFKGQFLQLKTAAQQKIQESLYTPGPSGHSLASIMGNDKAQEVMKTQMARFDDVEKMITDGNYGAIAINKNFADASTDQRTRVMLEQNNALANLAAVGNIKGAPAWLPSIASDPTTGFMKNTTKALNQAMQLDLANPQSSTPVDEMARKISTGQVDKGVAKSWFNGIVNGLSNPAAPPEITGSYAKKLFQDSPNFLSHFVREEQSQVFNQLVKPEVTQRMQELGKSNPDLWRSYSTWAKNNFGLVFKQSIDDINGVSDRAWMDVKFDPKANQFVVTPTEEGTREAYKNAGSYANPLNWIESVQGSNIVKQVDKINMGLKNITPILKADGFDPATEMRNLLHNNAVAPSDKKNDTFFQMMRRGVDSVIQKGDQEMYPTFGGNTLNFQEPSGKHAAGGIDIEDVKQAAAQGGDTSSLREVIGKAESGGDYGKIYGGPSLPALTSMTIGQVKDLQKLMKTMGSPSGAVGKYQVIPSTLSSVMSELGLKDTDVFDEKTQDRIADHLMERRGYSKFKAGKMSADEFHNSLAQEWAGLPTTGGQSAYEGDGLNHSTVSRGQVRQALGG